MSKLRWGILGTGMIARKFASALAESTTGDLVAVGSRNRDTAEAFGDEFNVPGRYADYQSLLDAPDVDAVYISTPHPVHAEWAVKAADAGKHILCEKPLTLNASEAMAVIDAARRSDVFLMEAFMYRCHPQTAKLVELIRDGTIGEVKMIQASFGFHAGFNPEGRLLNNELGGGGILDVGCYPVSMSRLVAGAALGRDFANPVEVKAAGHLGVTRVDEYAAAILRFENDIIAQVATGVQLGMENVVRVFGTKGSIFVPSPWFCGERTKIHVYRHGEEPTEVVVEAEAGIYTMEADTVAANIQRRQAPSPAMSWDDTLGNMRTLDLWRAGIGMIYDIEQPDANYPTIDHRPLAVRPGHPMQYGEIDGVGKPVSRLVMGVMLGGATFALPHASVLFDDFFSNGGNCFDTAHIYGIADQILGQWIANRGIRDQVVILGKGAHTPFCTPEHLTSQLLESLERMKTDYIDLYIMHRDNPDVPVGEFVDVLNEHKKAGRIRAFGGSNWTLDRVQEANDYAARRGLTGFAAVSNNFSLARMIEPPWAGCVSSSDPESRKWFEKTRIPLMAWSSLGRGFFVRGNSEDTSDPGLVACWYSEDNFQRLERARELGAAKGVPAVCVALAYVLRQTFPTFALIGPETLDELHTSLAGLGVELTADEMRWLNLED